MISNILEIKKSTLPEGEDEPIVVDNNLRRHWNDYTLWLASKGLKGNPKLDKAGVADATIEEYRKVNPKTLISKAAIPIIQKEFQNYRQSIIDKVKKGKAQFGLGTNEENFMKELSIVDSIAGSKTSSHHFPDEYLRTFENGKLISTENKGFAVNK